MKVNYAFLTNIFHLLKCSSLSSAHLPFSNGTFMDLQNNHFGQDFCHYISVRKYEILHGRHLKFYDNVFAQSTIFIMSIK